MEEFKCSGLYIFCSALYKSAQIFHNNDNNMITFYLWHKISQLDLRASIQHITKPNQTKPKLKRKESTLKYTCVSFWSNVWQHPNFFWLSKYLIKFNLIINNQIDDVWLGVWDNPRISDGSKQTLSEWWKIHGQPSTTFLAEQHFERSSDQ